jgi:hypothetical protein
MPTQKSTKDSKLSSLKKAVTSKKQTETVKTVKKTKSTNTQKVDGIFESGDIVLYSKNGKPIQKCKAVVTTGKDVITAIVLEGGGQKGKLKTLEPGRTTHYRGEKIPN